MNLAQLEKAIKNSKTAKAKGECIAMYTGTKFSRKKLCEIYKVDYKHVEAGMRKIEISELKKEYQHFPAKVSFKSYIELRKKMIRILNSFNTGYSMGDLKEFRINDKKAYILDNREKYANSCKWRENHGFFTINMKLKELVGIGRVNGAWTFEGKELVGKGKFSKFYVGFEDE